MLLLGIAPRDALSIHQAAIRAVEGIHHFDFGISVDAFIEPGFLKLVCGDHRIPVLVSELVRHDDLRQEKALGHEPLRICGNQRWIFHAPSSKSCRINDRELLVWIRTIPPVEELHRALGDNVVARTLLGILRLHQRANVDRPCSSYKCIFKHLVSRIGRPGEIVDVFGMEAERLCSVRVVRTRNLQTGSTDNLILWERQLYVEYTEIGKELSRLMKLMAVPC